MKTFMKSLVAIALVATMLVASLIVVSAADKNLATGAKYTIVRLEAGPGSAEEDGPAWILADDKNPETNGGDIDFTRLNDGWKKSAQSVSKSVFLAGSARTHRIKFDLGSVKTVSKIDLYMIDSYRFSYQGKHAANRGFNKDGFAVYSDADAKTAVKFKFSEANIPDEEGKETYFFIVTLTFDKAVSTQYITFDVQAELAGKHPECEDDEDTPGAYVVGINEVEIFGKDGGSAAPETTKAAETTKAGEASTPATQGGDASTPATQGGEATTPATQKPATTKDSGTAKAGDSSIAFIAIISVISLAGAAVVLKKRSF